MKINISFFFLILILFNSCANNSEEKSLGVSPLNQAEDKMVKQMISETDSLLVDMRKRRVFTSNTQREQAVLRESMTMIKNSLVKIVAGNSAKSSFRTLVTYVKKFEAIYLNLRDDAKISYYKKRLYQLIEKIAARLNLDVDNFAWILYETRFSELSPFSTFSTGGDWINDWSLGASYARVRGSGNKSWLISPLLDLSEVNQAAFKIHHLVSVDDDSRSDIPFDRTKIIKHAFKAYVSVDYISGEPEEANWQELKLSGFPSGVDFHAKWSDEIDLSQFKDKNVSIALVYDMDDDILGRHYVSWQVNRFQLIGAGPSFSYRSRPVKTYPYQDKFQKSNLGLNKSLPTTTAVEWEDFGFSGTEMAKIESSVLGTKTWLMSPKIKLDVKNPVLKLKEVVRNYIPGSLQVKISTDYDGGDPLESNWKSFEHIPSNVSQGSDNWENFNALEIDLSSYAGSEIVIGFLYLNDSGERTAWEIDELTIDGEGEALEVTELAISYERDDGIDDIEGVSIFSEYEFSEGLTPFATKRLQQTSADFSEVERNGQKYVEISGFKEKKDGKTRLISTKIKLGHKQNFFKLTQSINHYEAAAKKESFLKVILKSISSEKEYLVEAKRTPFGTNWDQVESEWVRISDDLKGKEIQVIFEYRCDKSRNIYPSWNLINYALGEK